MKRIITTLSVMLLTGCTTQAQNAYNTELSAWQRAGNEIYSQCASEPMTEEQYIKSYTRSNIAKRDKCENDIVTKVVYPVIVSPSLFSHFIDGSKIRVKQFQSGKLSYDEWTFESEIAAKIYFAHVGQYLEPAHLRELEQLSSFGNTINVPHNNYNRPTVTNCHTFGTMTNCTSY